MLRKPHIGTQESGRLLESTSMGKLKMLASRKELRPNGDSSKEVVSRQRATLVASQNESFYANQLPCRNSTGMAKSLYKGSVQPSDHQFEPNMTFNSLRNFKRPDQSCLRQSTESIGRTLMVNSSLLKQSKSMGAEQFLICEEADQPMCESGDMKKAKYKIKNSKTLLCSRCAILLLQRGYIIEEILPTAPKSEGVFRLSQRIRSIEERIQANVRDSCGNQVRDHVRTLFQEEVQLYDNITQIIKEMKTASIARYEGIFKKVQTELKAQQFELKQKMYEIQTIKNEINLYKMTSPQQDLQSTLSEWAQRLEKVEKFNRLEVQLKHQPLELQFNTIVANIRQSIGLEQHSDNLRGSQCSKDSSRNMFTRMLRESQQRLI